ncbi:hypothetical protein EV356DRAFT_572278 [Viridothelium virens]|uniref:SPIN90/Ldb17 leucine-rich domain-containing protein n=1 Tax=Viridothelium virens TaxID=1048519 RepID=A0A6A6HNM6_VIRVR|nr:hypothetical protein EV356DRAFT_572278 [Viridothelium virens]
MEFEVSYELENAEQFWDELDDIVATPCDSEQQIDDSLRSWLRFSTSYKDEYLQSEYDIARCSLKLTQSVLFTANTDYVRRQFIYCLLQEDDAPTLHLITTFLIFDGRANDPTFEMMKDEGAFPRLVELIQSRSDDDTGLHRLLIELLYEMSRIQQLGWEDLMTVDDAFVLYLFRIIEGVSNDIDDPYHYPVIRVLLVLNEQYMVALTPNSPRSRPMTNRVIKILSSYGTSYKTFGENLILLLNRESETSLQLLILKLLYLLFTTPSTQEYFYTNDLHVLVDVMIRNLLDLPDESFALRHTYLRVLHPLLAHTQLRHPPHYKRHELQRLFHGLGGTEDQIHFAPIDATTIRLVGRCIQIPWLKPSDTSPIMHKSNPSSTIDTPIDPSPTFANPENTHTPSLITSPVSTTLPTTTTAVEESTNSPDKPPNSTPSPPNSSSSPSSSSHAVAARLLGMHLASPEAQDSQLSVAEVATQMEKPGVKTPSKGNNNTTAASTPTGIAIIEVGKGGSGGGVGGGDRGGSGGGGGHEGRRESRGLSAGGKGRTANREKPLPPIPGREGRGAARTEARNGARKAGGEGLTVQGVEEGAGRERSPFSASEDEAEED